MKTNILTLLTMIAMAGWTATVAATTLLAPPTAVAAMDAAHIQAHTPVVRLETITITAKRSAR